MSMKKLLDRYLTELKYVEQRALEDQSCRRKGVGVSICSMIQPVINDGVVREVFQTNGPSRPDHECTNVIGGCGCSHAEPRAIMALLKNPQRLSNCKVLFCTYSPCTNCANIIIDSGVINGVVWDLLTRHDVRGAAFLKASMPCLTHEEIQLSIKKPSGTAQPQRSDIVEKVVSTVNRWHSKTR